MAPIKGLRCFLQLIRRNAVAVYLQPHGYRHAQCLLGRLGVDLYAASLLHGTGHVLQQGDTYGQQDLKIQLPYLFLDFAQNLDDGAGQNPGWPGLLRALHHLVEHCLVIQQVLPDLDGLLVHGDLFGAEAGRQLAGILLIRRLHCIHQTFHQATLTS